jgi:hypothetical protein
MRKQRATGAILALCCATLLAPLGCGLKNPPSTSPPVESNAGPPAASGTPNTATTGETLPAKKAQLKDLQLTLPQGWKAEYNSTLVQWKVETNAPPDSPFVLIWSLLPSQEPKGLIALSHRLQTSTALTGGWGYVLDRATEQGEFPDGYYVVGKVLRRTDRNAKTIGFFMVRNLGGQKLIFECFTISDPSQRQEALDFCKAAKF